MRATLSQCQRWVSGSSLDAHGAADAALVGDLGFDGVATDSRTAPAGSLFVALRGETFDAHAFLPEVAARGVAAIVVAQDATDAQLAGISVPLLRVPDTRVALGQIAHGWRSGFAIPLIGVTGSNGKTTVKEMIASILVAAVGAGHSMATRGNFNNEIGVPLTLLRLDDTVRAAVVELGMNHPGEIAVLSALAQPTVGLVNNAQREHQEFMATVEAVARENGAVFASLPADGVAVFPSCDAFTGLWRELATAHGPRRVLSFGLDAAADVRCTWTANAFGSDMAVVAAGEAFTVRLSAAGEHNVRNALAAVACTLAISMPVDAIVRGLESFAPVAGRLQRKTATSGAMVIDDTYNANPDSVRAAIDVLATAPAPRVLVLGDMGEVGENGAAFHEEIGGYARSRGVDHVLTLGDLATATATAFGAGATHYAGIDALQQAAGALATPAATVLVKGSRFMKMERVVHHLLGQQVQDSH
jgi:UDP-N-acetylmuramoyl-tripeptide--D-alanyl-D-alanine ligase